MYFYEIPLSDICDSHEFELKQIAVVIKFKSDSPDIEHYI
jgi:hypothetical protein